MYRNKFYEQENHRIDHSFVSSKLILGIYISLGFLEHFSLYDFHKHYLILFIDFRQCEHVDHTKARKKMQFSNHNNGQNHTKL